MDSLGCFGIRNSDKFILHFNQVCFQIYGMAPPYPIYMGKRAKISPKIHKIEIWPKSRPKVINSRNKSHRETIFGECLNYKSGLRILIWPLEVPFFLVRKWAFLAKMPIFGPKKMTLRVAKSKL